MMTLKKYIMKHLSLGVAGFSHYVFLRAKPEELSRTRPVIPPGQSKSTTQHTVTQHPGTRQSTAAHASKLKSTKHGVSESGKSVAAGSRAILHSTALNTTLTADVASGRNNNSMLR